jgi:hypothetical protein
MPVRKLSPAEIASREKEMREQRAMSRRTDRRCAGRTLRRFAFFAAIALAAWFIGRGGHL